MTTQLHNVTKTSPSNYVLSAAPFLTHGDCTPSEKKKVNCEGSHSVLATRCPKRKKLINQKRKTEQTRETASYSTTLKNNISNRVEIIHPPSGNVSVTASTHTTIFQSMLHAHFVNIANPGSYSKTFHDLMKANNLRTLTFPEEPPSLEIITRLSAVDNAVSGVVASSRAEAQSEKERYYEHRSNTSTTNKITNTNSTPKKVKQKEIRKLNKYS